MRKIKHYLEYLCVRLLSFATAVLPLGAARAVGRALGWFVFSAVRIRREVTINNLKVAFPEKSLPELTKIGRETFQHFGMVMLEFLRALSVPRNQIQQAIVSVKNKQLLDQIHQAGNGAIFLTAHFGNWEYAGGWLGAHGYPMQVMVQEQSNPKVNRLMQRCRERMGMQTIHRGTAMRSYLKALKSGEYAVMLADQDAGRDGLFVDFFGKATAAAFGPARFHLKTGAPILLFMTYRDHAHQLHMEIELLAAGNQSGADTETMREIMQEYHRRIETWIERYPGQWFWMHKKWKTQPQQRAGQSE